MKSFCIVALALVATCSAQHYTSDKNIDIDKLVKNKSELKEHLYCFLGKIDCTDEKAALKVDVFDLFATACSKCTDAQKRNSKLFLEAINKHFPEDAKDLQKKVDPEGKLLPVYLAAVADIN